MEKSGLTVSKIISIPVGKVLALEISTNLNTPYEKIKSILLDWNSG